MLLTFLRTKDYLDLAKNECFLGKLAKLQLFCFLNALLTQD